MKRPTLSFYLGTFSLFISAFFLYFQVLFLPNIYDTLLHIRINGGLNLANVWLPTDAFGFYRPFTFVPMLLVEAIFGRYPAGILNLINVLQHAIAAVLLVWLVYRLTRVPFTAMVVGLLFTIFPFSYQAIAVYGHNVHPQLVTVLLINLHLVISANSRASTKSTLRRWLPVLIVFIIGLLTHESYVLFGPFAFLLTLLFPATLHTDEPASHALTDSLKQLRPPLIFTMLGAAYIVAYQFLPISRAPQADSVVGSFWQKALYLIQAATWPLAGVGKMLNIANAQTIILLTLALTLLLTLFAWRRQWRLLLFGWGWWGLASLLLALPLPTGYLLNGPRLLYLGSVGVAFIWAAIIAAGFEGNRASKLSTLVLLGFMLLFGTRFIFQRLATYRELTQGISTLARSKSESVVLINLPQWLASPENQWPIGAEFSQQLGDYLFIEEWTANNIGRNMPTYATKIDELLATVPYGYEVHNQTSWDVISAEIPNSQLPVDLYVTRYLESGTNFDYVGRFTPWQYNENMATFDSYQLHSAEAYYCDEDIRLTSVWSYPSNQPPPPTASTFAQLLNADGVLISQNDRAPLSLPTSRITLNDQWQIVDVRHLAVTDDNLNNTLNGQVLLGVYDFTTGNREAAIGADGLLPDNALSLPITYCR